MNNQAIPPNGRAVRHQAAGEAANLPAPPIAGAAQNIAREMGNAQLHHGRALQNPGNHINPNGPFDSLFHAQTFDDLLACRAGLEQRLLTYPDIPTGVVTHCINTFSRVIAANAHLIPQLANVQRLGLVAFATFLAEFIQSQPRSGKIVNELPPEVALRFLKCLPEAEMDQHLNPTLMEIRRTLGLCSVMEDESLCPNLPQDLLADRSFAEQLTIAHDEFAFEFLAPELRETPYIQKLLRYAMGGSSLENPEENEDRCDANIVTAAAANDSNELDFMDDSLKSNRQFFRNTVKHQPDVLEYDTTGFRNDPWFMLLAVDANGEALWYAPPEFQNTVEIVTAAVENDGMALSHASDSAKDHKKIVLAAVKQNPMALQFASAPLRNNLDIAAAAVQKNGLALQFTLENPRLDREIVMSAVSSGGQGALEFAPLFKNDYLIQNIARMYIPGEQDRSSFA